MNKRHGVGNRGVPGESQGSMCEALEGDGLLGGGYGLLEFPDKIVGGDVDFCNVVLQEGDGVARDQGSVIPR